MSRPQSRINAWVIAEGFVPGLARLKAHRIKCGGRARLSQRAVDRNHVRLRGALGQTRPTHLVGFRGAIIDHSFAMEQYATIGIWDGPNLTGVLIPNLPPASGR